MAVVDRSAGRNEGDGEAVRQRVVRVFVSSTFRDMRAEREELAKRVFPQLRKLCESRGVTWGEVDLRWGITDEQKAEGKVLPICLEEIRRCRPFFIGLLGERYSWVPDPIEITDDLVERESWLAEHRRKSVTELEILHGVLNNPAMGNRALFYFRNPAYIDGLPKDVRDDFRESDSDNVKKLNALKDRIEKSGLALRKGYPDPETLGKWVLRDLTIAINQLFPEDERLDPLDRDAAEHEFLAQSRARVYIGRKEYFDRLDAHAESEDPPLVVLGESGVGKSALLANWALGYREKHPDDLFVMHFIGSSPYSADWAAMLRRIMGEFKRRFEIGEDIPADAQALRDAFPNWLSMASAQGKVVLILDALNQLEDRDAAPDLGWLPEYIPPNVRLIVSTLPGRAQDALERRGWLDEGRILTVEPLGLDERKELIHDFLAQYTKALSDARVDRIAADAETANPLYLRTLLDEIRLFGEHERLDERIAYYLETDTIPELYTRILERYEEDYERDRPGLARDAMRLLWAARRGLAQTELLDMLGAGDAPLPQAQWSPLYLAADQSLVERSGLITFAHDYLREAVEQKYLETESDRNAARLRIADYFDKRELGERKVDELPWQLMGAEAWRRLYDVLSDLDFFQAAWDANQFDVRAYWAAVEGNSDLSTEDAYASVLNDPETYAPFVWRVGHLLQATGRVEGSFKLRRFLVDHYRRAGDRANLSRALGNQASILYARGALDEAMALYKEQERLCREMGDKAGLQASLGNQAVILNARGALDEAMALHKEQERLCRELGDKAGLTRSLGHQALILKARGALDEAMALHEEEERLCRELGYKAGLQASLGNQALILYARGELDEAMALYKEQEQLCRELGDKAGLQASLGNQAVILKARGALDEAMALHKEEERLCRELGDKAGLQASLGNQAVILKARGALDEAMALHKEEERLCRELGDKAGLQASLGNQALILYARGELDEAMALYKEQEQLCRELGDKAGLSRSLGNQANILYARGALDEAMNLHKEVERLCRELGDKSGLSLSLGNQAVILADRGELDEAMDLLKEKERLCRQMDLVDGVAMSLANQALLLARGFNDVAAALPLAEEAYDMASEYGLTALAQQIRPILEQIKSITQSQ